MKVIRRPGDVGIAMLTGGVGKQVLYLGTYDQDLMNIVAYLQRTYNMNIAMREDLPYGIILTRMEDSKPNHPPTIWQRIVGWFIEER